MSYRCTRGGWTFVTLQHISSVMLTLFLFSTAQAPAHLDDGDLENHIKQLLLTLDSIRLEIADSWNHPARSSAMERLRQQLSETTELLNAATAVWDYRSTSMR